MQGAANFYDVTRPASIYDAKDASSRKTYLEHCMGSIFYEIAGKVLKRGSTFDTLMLYSLKSLLTVLPDGILLSNTIEKDLTDLVKLLFDQSQITNYDGLFDLKNILENGCSEKKVKGTLKYVFKYKNSKKSPNRRIILQRFLQPDIIGLPRTDTSFEVKERAKEELEEKEFEGIQMRRPIWFNAVKNKKKIPMSVKRKERRDEETKKADSGAHGLEDSEKDDGFKKQYSDSGAYELDDDGSDREEQEEVGEAAEDGEAGTTAFENDAVREAAVEDDAAREAAVIEDDAAREAVVEDDGAREAALEDAAARETDFEDGAVRETDFEDGAVREAVIEDGAVREAANKDVEATEAIIEDAEARKTTFEDGGAREAAFKDAAAREAESGEERREKRGENNAAEDGDARDAKNILTRSSLKKMLREGEESVENACDTRTDGDD